MEDGEIDPGNFIFQHPIGAEGPWNYDINGVRYFNESIFKPSTEILPSAVLTKAIRHYGPHDQYISIIKWEMLQNTTLPNINWKLNNILGSVKMHSFMEVTELANELKRQAILDYWRKQYLENNIISRKDYTWHTKDKIIPIWGKDVCTEALANERFEWCWQFCQNYKNDNYYKYRLGTIDQFKQHQNYQTVNFPHSSENEIHPVVGGDTIWANLFFGAGAFKVQYQDTPLTPVEGSDVLSTLLSVQEAVDTACDSRGKPILLLDNAPWHRSFEVTNYIKNRLNWELLFLPPYSPDLAPCDFYAIPRLSSQLSNSTFTSLGEAILKAAQIVQHWNFDGDVSNAFRYLEARCRMCIEKKGQYIEPFKTQ
jgi:hypothetical protein